MSEKTSAEWSASNAEYVELFERLKDAPPLYIHTCREQELRAENDKLRTALSNLLACLPDTRAMLLAREDAKAALKLS